MKIKISNGEEFYKLADEKGVKRNGSYEFADYEYLREQEEKFKEEDKKYTIFTTIWEDGWWILEGYHFINRVSYFMLEGEYEVTEDIEG